MSIANISPNPSDFRAVLPLLAPAPAPARVPPNRPRLPLVVHERGPAPAPTPLRPTADEVTSGVVTLLADLRRFARRIAGHSTAADDLVQETCRRALEARHQFIPGSDLRAWLFRILRNVHVDLLRRGAHEIVAGVNGNDLPARAIDERPIWEHLSDADVAAALAELPPTYSRTYALFAIDRLSYTEIAAAMKMPIGTVGTRLRRARLRLREILMERLAEGAPAQS